ncbi:MAG: hypothetical protein K8R53_02240, partial [Bacteroidales bacterium]|nr:hypothetical protein [Bacteroidales bacterium]
TFEIDKSAGELILLSGATISCSSFDWTLGLFNISDGEFSALSLADNGISGDWEVYTNGVVNLTNSTGYVDLLGNISMWGGEINVYGGIDDSFWPGDLNASILIYDGIVDFKETGIYVRPTGVLTEAFNNGFIKTTGDLYINRSDFTPLYGIWKMYGANNAEIRIDAGWINQLQTSKTGTKAPVTEEKTVLNEQKYYVNPVKKPRNGNFDGGVKGDVVTSYGDLSIQSLVVQKGTFNSNGNSIYLNGVLYIYGNLEMTDPNDEIEAHDVIWESGSSDNITSGVIKVREDWYFNNGTSASFGGNSEVHFISSGPSKIYCYDADASFREVIFDKSDGSVVTSQLNPASTEPLRVIMMTINNDDHFWFSDPVYLNNEMTIEPGGVLQMITGAEMVGGTYSTIEIAGDLDISGGYMNFNDFDLKSTGVFDLTGGEVFIDNIIGLDGTLNMSDGLINSYGAITIPSGLNDNISGGLIQAVGGFSAIYAGTFQPSGGTVQIKNISDQISNVLCTNGNYFHDIEFIITHPFAIASIDDDIIVKHNFIITEGHVYCQNNDIELSGSWTNSAGEFYFNEGTGTVTFTGNWSSSIHTDETFYNLVINKTNIFTNVPASNTVNVLNDLSITGGYFELGNNDNLYVQNDLTIELDAGLRTLPYARIFLGGNWLNNNIDYTSTRGFYPAYYSTVTFNGSGLQTLTTNAPHEDIYNLVIDKSGNKFRSNNNLHILGDLSVVQGMMEDNVTELSHEVYGDVLVDTNGTLMNVTMQNTVTFAGTDDQTITGNNGTIYFWYLYFDKTSKKSNSSDDSKSSDEYIPSGNPNSSPESMQVTIDAQSIIAEYFAIEEGIVLLNGNLIGSHNSIHVFDGGQFIAGPNSTICVGQNEALSIQNGGILEMTGTYANEVTFKCISDVSGSSSIAVTPGGNISAVYVNFKDLYSSGVYVAGGTTIDPLHSFNNCTFTGRGNPSSLLTINNDQILTIDSAHFTENTYGAIYNVKKDYDKGEITFTNATGFFAGPSFEDDAYGRIHWDGFTPGLWTGEVSSDWHNYKNWDDLSVPDVNVTVTIPAGTPNSPNIAGSSASCDNIIIVAGAIVSLQDETLTVTNDISISGQFQMNHTSGQLFVGNDILWEAGSTANITGNAEMIISGDWYFNAGANVQIDNGYVEFVGTNPGYIRCYESNCYFNHIRSNKTSNYIAVAGGSTADLDINGNLYIYSGSDFNVYSTHIIKLNGFIENNVGGGLHCDAGEFVFDGGSVTHTFRWGDYFENIEVSSSGTVAINSDMIINNDLLISSGTLNPNFSILAKGNLTIYGNIEMTDPASELTIWYDVTWKNGSTSNISNGSIWFSGDWTFENGTMAQLGVGNTVYSVGMANHFIKCFESNSSFGNLVIDMNSVASTTHIFDGNTETVNVSGDLTVIEGIFDIQSADLYVVGSMDIVDGTEMRLGTGGFVTNDSFFTLNGYLNVGTGDVLLNDRFQLAPTGELSIN